MKLSDYIRIALVFCIFGMVAALVVGKCSKRATQQSDTDKLIVNVISTNVVYQTNWLSYDVKFPESRVLVLFDPKTAKYYAVMAEEEGIIVRRIGGQ